ncbi:MAG: exodeoxyribonuclease III [Planctomycetota bacterium]|jgi:exodeoxyribonuclease-3
MKIATWNVNSIRARLSRIVPWLREHSPDIVCLQETKVVDGQFPKELLEDEGYNVVVSGQKTYNGVAVLAQHPIENVITALPNDDERAEKRVLGCCIEDFMILNLYVPNGREVGHEHFHYKLGWMKRVRQLLDESYDPAEKVVVTGDFNITFDDRDVHDPERYHEKIHCSTPERDALRDLMGFGLHDGLRKFHEEAGIYTWWDYRTRGFSRDEGLRIDHFLLSQKALDACDNVWVDKKERDGKTPSDHAPVLATFG